MTREPAVAAACARFAQLDRTRQVLAALRPGAQRAAGGLWGASAALLIATLGEERPGPLLVVTADDETAANLEGDLRCFTARELHRLVTQEIDVDGHPEATSLGRRLEVLHAIASRRDIAVVAGLGALLDPVPRPRALRGRAVTLRVGERVAQDSVLAQAAAAGLRRVPVVLAPGEVSQRGDVLDVYPLGSPIAVRVEFLADEVESIRQFDPATQRSLAILPQVELQYGQGTAIDGHVIEHVGRPNLLLVQHEPLRLEETRAHLLVGRGELAARWHAFADSTAQLTRLDVSSLPSQDLDFKVLSAGSAVGAGEADPVGRLRAIRGVQRGDVTIVCRSAEEAERLGQVFAHKNVALADERVALRVGSLHRGFRIPDLGLTVLSNVEFAGVPQATRVRERSVVPTKALRSFFELGPGDLVVHAAHGIALFEGIERIERGDAAEDHLKLRFRNDVRLLVPAAKIHLVQKYVGAGEARPQLDRLGGKGFARRKEEVVQALYDVAAELLDLMAQRALLTRPPYPRDPLEDAFLDGFPFTDTDDQKQAWSEIRQDLEDERVSERLLCGDVGFGKTELAMRAAFKVAITGRQVAVLAPTTILAEQHGQTFAARFAPHGLRVEILSRYRTGRDTSALLADLAAGSVDVVIGTHRLLGADVVFKQLGLLIVDEEQRFGVRHKEQLKQRRVDVDVLSMSATPIPRTLHAAMLGVRNISTLAIAPPGRQEVETHVVYWDSAVVQAALCRELDRGGQVFVVHNRIDSLDAVARAVAALVPQARLTTGHGQMNATDLERAIRRFVHGEVDILVSTAIVENGLDIPRSNTILVDRADQFGLAELHQLRGRVGRSERQAYCYLLLDRSRPPSDDARKRLKALEEFSHLGAGFAVAMKDLEIRGAGNLLGPQQSGHIAAVGYEMYVELLRGSIDAVRRNERLAPRVREVDVDLRVSAFIPDTLAQDAKERLELLRELDGAVDEANAIALARSLRDRFGALPVALTNLLQVFLVKHQLLHHDVLGVQFTGEDRIVVRTSPGQPLGGAWLDQFAAVRPVEAGKTHLLLPKRRHGWRGESVLALLLDALLGAAAAARIRAAWKPTTAARPVR